MAQEIRWLSDLFGPKWLYGQIKRQKGNSILMKGKTPFICALCTSARWVYRRGHNNRKNRKGEIGIWKPIREA